jgi:hypothetical protein
MGTDIHVMLEWRDGDKWYPFNPEPDPDGPWDSWGKFTPAPTPMEILAQELNIDGYAVEAYVWNYSRDYRAFGQLAGVRSHERQMFEPDSVPVNCHMGIWSTLHMKEAGIQDWDERVISEAWLSKRGVPYEVRVRDGVKWIRDPDFHTPGCLEMVQLNAVPDEYLAGSLVELVQEVKRLCNLRKIVFQNVRMIFWFDN